MDFNAQRMLRCEERLHAAWHELEGARLLADNNGLPSLANEIEGARMIVGQIEGRVGVANHDRNERNKPFVKEVE